MSNKDEVTIPLVGVGSGLFAKVDRIDYDRVSQYRWCAVRSKGRPVYVARYFGAHGIQSLHRFITNAHADAVVDHINGDTLDNRRANLRQTNDVVNGLNRHKKLPKWTSRFIGVSWAKHVRKWKAQIAIEGIKYALGYFTKECDAQEARELAYNNYIQRGALPPIRRKRCSISSIA